MQDPTFYCCGCKFRKKNYCIVYDKYQSEIDWCEKWTPADRCGR